MGERGIRFENKGGVECCISRGGQMAQWRYTSWWSLRNSQCVISKRSREDSSRSEKESRKSCQDL